ncbi:GINS complex, Sld5 component [Hesseltinella vesiculosa]|uniref:DNA replication complex GINS protein SLD5 n=1 Tax=Hesseltinella vesiculosa TaxID=101127 RepID=A0A1X2G773_9FUNG|nr:GINS complex, Sld5 component [Hesseltinella vesiculosa]
MSFDSQRQTAESSFSMTQANALHARLSDDALEDNVLELTKVWMNERNAPELLPYRKQLVDFLIERIEDQAGLVMDHMSSNLENKFISMLFQTEMERIRYLIKSYLRTRLHKIEKYTLELLRRPDYQELMSAQEIAYARRYQELLETYNHDSFLHHLPPTQHKQDEMHGDLNMVVTANLEAPVFCRVLDDVGVHQWMVNDTEESTEMDKGGTYIIRYRAIKELLQEGRVQLI